jgi:hypothetical protein
MSKHKKQIEKIENRISQTRPYRSGKAGFEIFLQYAQYVKYAEYAKYVIPIYNLGCGGKRFSVV